MLTTQNVDRQKLSEMMKTYVEIKDSYSNDIVLFRVGDFFEAYFQDAVLVSQITGIRLTAKKIGSKTKKKDKKGKVEVVEEEEKVTAEDLQDSKILIPMAGVPHKTLMAYSNQLIVAGRRVVVVEQLEDPKDVKGRNIKRGVVAILTTQNLTGEFLTEYLNNFLCVIYQDTSNFGLCFADITTGDIYLTTADNISGVLNEIARYKPSEIVLTQDSKELLGNLIETRLKLKVMMTIEDSVFKSECPIEKILESFNISDIEDIKYTTMSELKSLYAMLNYIEYTQKIKINFGSLPNCYTSDYYMNIDLDSRSNLELCENLTDRTRKGTLLSVLDNCKTSMGSRLLKQWLDKPLLNRSKIERRLLGISELVVDTELLENIQNSMIGILDISRIMGRLKMGRSIPRDLVNLHDSLRLMPKIYNYMSKFNSDVIKECYNNMGNFEALVYLLDNALLDDPAGDVKEGLVIKQGYNSELDTARDMEANSNKYLTELEMREREKTGIKNLRVVNKNGKCTIEVTKSNIDKVPDYYRVEKPLKGSTRYITDESEKLEKELYSSIERSKSIEIDLYEELKSLVLQELRSLTTLCEVISTFDVLCGLANIAVKNNYVCPKINTDGYIDIKGGRHPVVEKFLSDKFIANDAFMNMEKDNFLLITGPNMAGKSTYMRQVALITIMAHIGSFVPAEYADIAITDRIFTRIGASDDISSGRSTYMVEMTEVKNILDNATKNSLVLLDEVGRGTSTSDGLAIAQSLAEYIYKEIGCKTLFATHYHELIFLEKSLKGLKNYHMSVSKDNGVLTFLRKIESGGLSESYGIDVAQLAGIPESVIDRAWVILKEIEETTDRVVEVEQEVVENEIIQRLKKLEKSELSPITAYKILSDLIDLV